MRNMLSRFSKERSGAVAVLFAIAIAPLVALVGSAVDYSRLSLQKTKVQTALDAAALAAVKDARTLSGSALQDAVDKAFRGNLGLTVGASVGSPRVVIDGTKVRLTVDGSVRTEFMQIAGFASMPLTVVSEASWNQPIIEITLVLDNTGSMGWSGKMSALKTATRELLTTLEATRQSPDQIRVAIVPFDTQVNVGPSEIGQPWLRFDGNGLDPSLVTTAAAWRGCLTDRDQPYDATNTAPTSDPQRYRAARCATGSLAAMHPLTANYAPLRSLIDAMQPSGFTNITIGLQTGLAVATGSIRFTRPNSAPGAGRVERYMVLLTDGDNTMSRYVNSSGPSSAIDARTRLACDAVKNEGVQLFTVRVIEGNEPLLRACATNPTMYYSVNNAAGIGEAFRAITRTISQVRLSV